MGKKRARRASAKPVRGARDRISPGPEATRERRPRWRRAWVLAAGAVLIAGVAVVAGIASAPNGPGTAARGTTIQGVGGHWTNVTPDTLASMLEAKDFTLLNVKTPYLGEIAGTDLYVPYTDLSVRVAELPQDRASRILVYCRSGAESAVAAQTLLDLGFTDIVNLDGGMNAWVASGRSLVQKERS